MGKREAGNPILNILSKSTLAIFSLGEIPFYPLRSTSKTDNEDGTLVKTENPIKCDICMKMFKSSDNLQTHDKKFHIEKKDNKDKFYKWDQCISTFARKSELLPHINESHKKCNICECIFTNITILQTHMKAIHKKQLTKHKTIKSKRYHK